MGFLDHSTNNIIIDAVLTDTGRRLLSDNQGRFEISFFSLGDDEVDYTIIEKFGRAVGAEKISKNTPIFEAQTKESLALKNRLLTLPDPTVARLPSLNLTSGVSGNTVEITVGAAGSSEKALADLTFKQQIQGSLKVPSGLADLTFTVIMPDRFARLTNETPISWDTSYSSKLAYYEIGGSIDNSGNGGGMVSFTVENQDGMDDTIFSIYGDSGNKTQITTQISVIGGQSGIRRDLTLVVKR
jgi:hypothetical protein